MTDVTQRPPRTGGPRSDARSGGPRAEPALRADWPSRRAGALAGQAALVVAIGLCVIGWLAAARRQR